MLFSFDNTYSKLDSQLFQKINPTPVSSPKLKLFNESLAKEIGLKDSSFKNELITDFLSGNKLPPNSEPLAMAYSGHQFGHFNILGDGRAILLGEHVNFENQRFDIQLKGSGRTAYSRSGDGRATLYSMLREYLISEAMYNLNIPTSRSLAVIESPDPVFREIIHKTAVLTRVMKSHIRIAHFEHILQFESEQLLNDFLNYTVKRLYPSIANSDDVVYEFFMEVMNAQIELVVNWSRVGFIHGVLNTDNTSISAETFDYGPCAFMNSYDLNTCYSSIDKSRRYAFGQQASIIRWNLSILANTMFPIMKGTDDEKTHKLNQALTNFKNIYTEKFSRMMANKIGFVELSDSIEKLIFQLLSLMEQEKLDYTNTFISLENYLQSPDIKLNKKLNDWVQEWSIILPNKNQALSIMKKMNPLIIPRNELVEEALIKAKEGDMQTFNELLEELKNPYERRELGKKYSSYNQKFDSHYKTYCGT